MKSNFPLAKAGDFFMNKKASLLYEDSVAYLENLF
jgi:hypothetical protein